MKTAGEGLIDVSVQLDLLKKASKLLKAANSAMSKLSKLVEKIPEYAEGQDLSLIHICAISCLTEPFYFQGADQYLREIAAAVQIPVLRKDFTVDEYMIYQAKSCLLYTSHGSYPWCRGFESPSRYYLRKISL